MLRAFRWTLVLISLLSPHVLLAAVRKPAFVAPSRLSSDAVNLLRAQCGSCHSSAVKSGGIDLSSRSAALAAGAFSPGRPVASKLLQMVKAGKMPPSGKLPDANISLLEGWISAGAAWPAAGDSSAAAGGEWALRPVHRPAVPHSPFDALAVNPIDSFLFARL